jgi:hypothetical protein
MSQPGLNDLEGANSALSTALCLWRQCPDAWLSWGQLCDKRYEENPMVRVTKCLGLNGVLCIVVWFVGEGRGWCGGLMHGCLGGSCVTSATRTPWCVSGLRSCCMNE